MRALFGVAVAVVAACAAVADDDAACEDVRRSCLEDHDCPGGYRCNTAFEIPQCTQLFCGTQDHPCDNDHLCAMGFTCVQDGTCRSSLPLGSGCGEALGEFPCDDGLSCEHLADLDFGYCVSPDIEGSICEPGVFECDAPLVCGAGGESAVGYACVDPDREGTPCDNELVHCGDDLTCGGDPATCERPGTGQSGEGCVDAEYCAAQLLCRAREWQDDPTRCLPPAELGEFCGADDECEAELVCVFATCRPIADQGDPCQWSEHCAAPLTCGLFGGEGTCRGTAGPGDACELHTDCTAGECACDEMDACVCVD